MSLYSEENVNFENVYKIKKSLNYLDINKYWLKNFHQYITISGSGNYLGTDGNNIWVSSNTSGGVAVIDPYTNTTLKSIAVSAPSEMAFDGRYMWIVKNSTEISRIDSYDYSISTTFSVTAGFTISKIFFDGNYIWVAGTIGGTGMLAKYNYRTYSLITIINLAASFVPYGITYDDSDLWVCSLSPILLKINTTTNAITNVPVTGTPISLYYDGTYVWMAHASNNIITKLDINGNVIKDIEINGSGSYNITYDGLSIWGYNYSTKSLFKINTINDVVVAVDIVFDQVIHSILSIKDYTFVGMNTKLAKLSRHTRTIKSLGIAETPPTITSSFSVSSPIYYWSVLGYGSNITIVWNDVFTYITPAEITGIDAYGRDYYETGGFRYTRGSYVYSDSDEGPDYYRIFRTNTGVEAPSI